MPRGISLHVGINNASSAFPGAPPLKGAENDASEMDRIAVANGFEQHDLLLGSDATHMRVTTKIRSAATQLQTGDIFLFTFAGHGFQHVDVGDRDESDRLDETMLLFDAELFDDVLRKELWPCFDAGVRVLMVADCCHSGSVFMMPDLDPIAANLPPVDAYSESSANEFPVTTPDRFLARTISIATGERHQAEYGEFYRNSRVPLLRPAINASLLLLAACADKQKTGDGDPNGIYTAAMLKVLRDSDPDNYDVLVQAIQSELTAAGRPQNAKITAAGQIDPVFRGQRPFTI